MREQRIGRRAFVVEVGRGMLIAGLGPSVVDRLAPLPRGSPSGDGAAGRDRLTFGAREPLVALVGETPPDRLLPRLVAELRAGTKLEDLVAAAALANARAFGGEDYVGFHVFMALSPAWQMARALPKARQALPVLKVLYRNAVRLAARGSGPADTLQPLAVAPPDARGGEAEVRAPGAGATAVRGAVHRRDVAAAEATFATAGGGFEELLPVVHDAVDVHRIVLAHRAHDMRELAGAEHATTLLRQALRYCVKTEAAAARHMAEVRALVPELLARHRLLDRALGARAADDAWIESTSRTLFSAPPAEAAAAVATALAEGVAPDAVAEAIALAANQLLLRDAGRRPEQAQEGKPAGSVHGDSLGVHACDSVHAWRHVAAASARHACASLILAGYHVARDRALRGAELLASEPRPHAAAVAAVAASDPRALLAALDAAIADHDQDGACAIAQRYLDLGHAPRAAFDLLLEHTLRADGALHAEKFYWTAADEFARARPSFRARHLIGLARVTASASATPAAGYPEACELLGG